MGEFQNKTIIVTGGASGIGRAIAEKFAAENGLVWILDLNDEEGQKMAGTWPENVKYAHCDVSNHEETSKIVAGIFNKDGCDVLINNAGIAHIGDAATTNPDDLDRIYQVNIKGVYNLLNTVIPYMKENGGGSILNMASVAGTVGISQRFAYSASKGAVLAMTYSVAKDFVNDGIRCNSVSPGRVHTPFVDGFLAKNYPGQEKEMFEKLSKTQPIGRMGLPQEIADLVLFLCSEKAGFITGTDFPIDGGFIKLNS